MTAPQVIILAGPNGAGKTTFARSFLPAEAACQRFINADLIAAGLSPFAPEQAALRAGRLMLEEIHASVVRRDSFALETTLSGRGYLPMIRAWRQQGYRVSLFYLRLPSVEAAIARVAERVRQGGHDIPTDVIRRRYRLGWDNVITHYRPIVDEWAFYDMAGRYPVFPYPDDSSQLIRDSFAAMQRAAEMARDIAIQTDTAVIYWQDGEIIRRSAAELRAERQLANPQSAA